MRRRLLPAFSVAALLLVAAAGAAPTADPFSVTALAEVARPGADPTAAVLPDGRVRLQYASGPGKASLISSDGIHFTTEAGIRLGVDVSGPHARIVRLADGRWRMFFQTPPSASTKGIGSAISTDGLAFTVEPGLRVTVAAAGVGSRPDLSPGEVVKLPDGRWRMYFSSFRLGPRVGESELVKSAVSSDLLTWTVEPGVRIGAGSSITGSAEHPAALVNSNGSVTLFYGRPTPGSDGLWVATASDGLTFTSESKLIGRGTIGARTGPLDSSVVKLGDGTILLYWGDRDVSTGVSYINVARLTPTSAPSPTPMATVSVTVKGKGRVSGAGISCPTKCSTNVVVGRTVTLRAAAAKSYRFVGWGGGCSGRGACVLKPTAAVNVVATFRKR